MMRLAGGSDSFKIEEEGLKQRHHTDLEGRKEPVTTRESVSIRVGTEELSLELEQRSTMKENFDFYGMKEVDMSKNHSLEGCRCLLKIVRRKDRTKKQSQQ